MKKITRKDMLWNAVMHEKAVHDCQSAFARLVPQLDKLRVDVPIACPSCTDTLPPQTLECSSCRTALDADIVEAIRDISFEIAYFGVLYRKQYEEDINEGKVDGVGPTHHYFLPLPNDTLVYLVSLAVSGIIGGLAHDAIKSLLKTALRKFKGARKESALANASIDQFLKYTQQYLDSMLDEESTQFRSRVEEFESGLILVERIRITLESPSASVDEAQIIERLASDPTNLSPEGKEYVKLAWSFRREIQTLETYMKSRAQYLETRKGKGKQQQPKSE